MSALRMARGAGHRLASALAVGLAILGGGAAAPPGKDDSGGEGLRVWSPAAVVMPEAVAAGRPVFVEFFRRSCGPCQRLHAEVYPARQVAPLLGAVIKAGVDIETREAESLMARYSVTVTPTILLADPTGQVIRRIDGLPPPGLLVDLLRQATVIPDRVPSDPEGWIAAGDLVSDAGAGSFASECYLRAMDWPGADPEVAEGARLRYAREREKAGDGEKAAAALEEFTRAESPSAANRAGLDALIRIRKSLGDAEGEDRARDAFRRLYPALKPPS